MRIRPFLIVILSLSPLACGNVDTTGGTGGSTSTSTSSGSSTSGGASSGHCPATEPSGGSCDAEGLHCTWGDEVRAECRAARTCTGGAWSAPEPACVTPPADHCDFTEPPTGQCTHDGDSCIVGAATICRCAFDDGGPSDPFATWRCHGAPGSSCPPIAPNDGSACSTEGLHCSYGNFCVERGADARCTNGAWLWNRDTQSIDCAG